MQPPRPLRHSQEVIAAMLGESIDGRSVSDTATSVLGAIGVNSANNAFDSSLVVSNADGSVLERLEALQALFGMSSGQAAFQPAIASKTVAGTALTTGASPFTLFTVTGTVLMRVWAFITTGLTSTGGTGTIAIGVTGNTAALIAATTADGTNFPTGSVWAGDTSPTVKGEALTGSSLNGALIASNVIATIATNSMTAGSITFFAEWRPVSAGATVVAA